MVGSNSFRVFWCMFNHPRDNCRQGYAIKVYAFFELLTCLFIFLFAGSCDRGFYYKPVGDPTPSDSYVWSRGFDNFTIEFYPLSGIIGSTATSEFEVVNHAYEPLMLESAEIRADSRSFAGELTEGTQSRTVEPGKVQRLYVYWKFGREVTEALGDHPAVLLSFRIGAGQSRRVEIAYQRQD